MSLQPALLGADKIMSLNEAKKANRELSTQLNSIVKEFHQGYSYSHQGQIQGKYTRAEINKLLESDQKSDDSNDTREDAEALA